MNFKYIHFIGIKGVAMTALAIVAKEMGAKVTGSDVEEDFPTSSVLQKFKITPLLGFKQENIVGRPDLVIVTGAHGGRENLEAQAALKMGLRVLMHGQALAEFTRGKKVLAVAGNHGKTTVAAMMAHLLVKSGFDPSFAVGCGDIKSLASPGHAGQDEDFIVEADEYLTDPSSPDPTPRFFWLKPSLVVLTNIEYDHPDAFKDVNHLCQAFLTFVNKITPNGLLIAGIDSKKVRSILPKVKVPFLTYGFSPQADYRLSRVSFGQERTWFWLTHHGITLGQFALKVPGKFNALNAVAAGLMANCLGLAWEEIRRHLSTFSGIKRRFELIKEKKGVKYFDDYAHHPTQISQTLEGARAWFPEAKIICLFQPHTYSRTRALLTDFAQCFAKADEVIILPIYASAREKPDPNIDAKILAREIQKYHHKIAYFDREEEAVKYLKKTLVTGSVVLTIGAGDIYKIHQSL